MNWSELRRYIDGLHRAGFDVATLTVQLHRKLAFPLIAPISMFLAFPFAFLVGTRGAIGGVAVGVAIGILYWLGAELLTAMGGVGSCRRCWQAGHRILFSFSWGCISFSRCRRSSFRSAFPEYIAFDASMSCGARAVGVLC